MKLQTLQTIAQLLASDKFSYAGNELFGINQILNELQEEIKAQSTPEPVKAPKK